MSRNMPVILFLGTVSAGVSPLELRKMIGSWKYGEAGCDLVVGNGNGVLGSRGNVSAHLEKLFDSGIDIVTSGGDALARTGTRPLLVSGRPVIRPLNFPPAAPGKGFHVIDLGTGRLGVVNLFTGNDKVPVDDPLDVLDSFIRSEGNPVRGVLVDVFGRDLELKKALFLRARSWQVPVHIIGTGFHLPTGDAEIRSGRFFVSDAGGIELEDMIAGFPTDAWWSRRRRIPPVPVPEPSGRVVASGIRLTLGENMQVTGFERLGSFS